MPSKNMIRKGKRRQTVKHEYRLHRDAVREQAAAAREQVESEVFGGAASPAAAEPAVASPAMVPPEVVQEGELRWFVAGEAARGRRLDAYLAQALPEVSRMRVQLLIEQGRVRVGGRAAKASLRLEGGERVEVEGEAQAPPPKAEAEQIPLRVVYEDADLAVVDKPAGMTVHAGAGGVAANRGTLVNALLWRFGQGLSAEGGALRPGIVHRLDKETSGLIVVAKNDAAHRRLAAMFAARAVHKVYVALVHGAMRGEQGTVELPVGRDPVRRVRMTAKLGLEQGARAAVSHWRVLERMGSKDAPFTLLEVRIETGRTHQIRVHLAALGHPVAGDVLYGAPKLLRPAVAGEEAEPTLGRNFLHAGELAFAHPRTGEPLELRAELPGELEAFLRKARGGVTRTPAAQAKAGGGRMKAR